jgi:hypothetical protein
MICMGIGAVESGYADEKEHASTCTLATLKGWHLFATSGNDFPASSDTTCGIRSRGISYI